MGNKNKRSLKRKFAELTVPSRWEAPDRNFPGHRDILTRNLARYNFVAPIVAGHLLEVGCGRGYGLEFLSQKCSKTVGVDISEQFLLEAKNLLPNMPFLRANGSSLPFLTQKFDSIIAFDVIEHIENDIQFLEELRRLARPGATIAISTPNKTIASGKSTRPLDRFHIREYEYSEFDILLNRFFSSVQVYGQMENSTKKSWTSLILNAMPIRWKYSFPTFLQSWISVFIRPPLKIEECLFSKSRFLEAHTFVALCSV